MRSKHGKAKSGTWATRDLLNSRAFWALSSTAKGMLFQFLMKRDMDRQHKCLNQRNITMTYLELENLFFVMRTKISREDLLMFTAVYLYDLAFQIIKIEISKIEDEIWTII